MKHNLCYNTHERSNSTGFVVFLYIFLVYGYLKKFYQNECPMILYNRFNRVYCIKYCLNKRLLRNMLSDEEAGSVFVFPPKCG